MSEIKTSFSWKYIVILIVGTLIGVGGNIIYSIYAESQNKQSLTITSVPDTNKIKQIIDSNILDIKYSLSNDSTEIKSFFENTIVVTNNSNRGIENIILNIKSDNVDINLIKNPKISTSPKEIKSSLEIDYKSNFNHQIIIPLLNKEETIILNYESYSLKEIKSFKLSATVRKKDVYIEYEDELDFNKAQNNNDKYNKFIYTTLSVLALILTVLATILLNKRQNTELQLKKQELQLKKQEIELDKMIKIILDSKDD